MPPKKLIPQIASGKYGCVYKPPIHCQPSLCNVSINFERCNKGVSKLMSYEHAVDEYNEHSKIVSLIGDKYNLRTPLLCKPTLNSLSKYDECKSIKDGDEKGLLIFDDAGKTFFNKLKEQMFSILKFKVGMLSLFEGVMYMSEHGIVHGDIKENNIMVDVDYNFKFIDFGISWTDEPLGQAIVFWWPPEYYLLGTHVTKIKGGKLVYVTKHFKLSEWYKIMKTLITEPDPRLPDNIRIKLSHEEMKNLYELIKSKVDVYSLGILLKHSKKSNNPYYNEFLNDPNMISLIDAMTDKDVTTRLSAKEAYEAYKIIIGKGQQKTTSKGKEKV